MLAYWWLFDQIDRGRLDSGLWGAVLGSSFIFSRELSFRSAGGSGWKLARHVEPEQIRQRIAQQFHVEAADAVAAAIISGRSYQAILDRAETAERERLLIQPQPLHGSATWPGVADVGYFLKGRDHFDSPLSILFGTFQEGGAREPATFVHWHDEGYLLTVAPTKAKKRVTTIPPNLLHYRGSVVVFDPKGELYNGPRPGGQSTRCRSTASRRSMTARTRPPIIFFSDGFNPFARIRSLHQSRRFAQLMISRGPNGKDLPSGTIRSQFEAGRRGGGQVA
ncbi:type IV secretory system conjugative DNA transfer family protein [Bradyrhizobium sp. UFLA05-109]